MEKVLEYLDIREWPLEDGAMFTDQDVRGTAKVCIIGKTIVNQLFPNEDPIGQIVRIRDIPFKILGVLTPKGLSVMNTDQDDVIIVPYTSEMKRVSKRTNLSMITIQAASPAVSDSLQRGVSDLLRDNTSSPWTGTRRRFHHSWPARNCGRGDGDHHSGHDNAFGEHCLCVIDCWWYRYYEHHAGQRHGAHTREIGIRMAVGAHGRDILLQFLIEAITLSSLGGIIGILLGVGAAKLLSAVAGWPTLISITSITVAFLFSAAVGVFFGFYPARKASNLDPIDALRYE